MTTRALLGLVLMTNAAAVSGCAVSEDPFAGDSEAAQGLTAVEAQRVLDLVNYPGVDRAALDTAVGLDGRAANAIDEHRAGADERFPSIDDQPFATIAALDAVPYVGDTAFRKLAAYAQAHPAPRAEQHEGVAFKGWQAEIVVWGANTVPVGVLNGMLDNRAAANVIAARPLASLAALAAVPLVGGNALGAMRGQATTWWHARKHQTTSLAGTFDGVDFDAATAEQALAIANTHSRDEMVAGGVYGNGASAIVGNRPYTSLAGVAAVAGVGASTMQGLHAYATALLATPPHGTTPEDGECAATPDCALGLVCAGTTFYDVGHCRPAWMAGTFSDTTDVAIPDNATAIQRSLQVSGLASVVEDLIVHLDIDHPRKQDLYITLTQPSSAESLIWDVDSSGHARVVVGGNVERDSSVNGTWTLQVTDHVGGSAGTLRGWSLELTSRLD
jgi:DNA uptake protein ComE-like DNA-binding protein